MRRARLALVVLGLALAGCGIVRVEGQPDPAEIPSGPLEAMSDDAVGPVTEVGSGRTLGIGWRYAIYETADGICTQLEMANFASGSCGSLPLLSEESVFGGVGTGGDPGGTSDSPTPIDGIVSSQVAAVWIETASGARIAATLMPLAGAGHNAAAFVGFVPAGETATGVVATDADGELLETFDLP